MQEPAGMGILYLAFGRPYLSMALLSASTARRSNPDLPICIVTNVVESLPELAFWDFSRDKLVFINEETSMNRYVKTRLNVITPFDKTIFVDCDTKVLGSLAIANLLLDYFDVCVRLNRRPQVSPGKGDRLVLDGVQVVELPHWNSGVLLFRKNDRVSRFFGYWNQRFQEIGVPFDQVALVEAVFKSDARVLSLDDRWNDSDPVINRREWRSRVKIFHYASNISDRLMSEIMSFDGLLSRTVTGEDSAVTLRFLRRKRESKRRKLGILRYAALRVLWAVSSPT